MNLAKVPDREESHWESLDIFLFTNGQQQSPPRKYHLKANELNLWEATLKTLAQSLYGATQSTVDLYTVDGHKSTFPTEIINDNIYVAVLPQDKFIHAGYTDYLLKASKSREKRMGKFKKPSTIGPSHVGQVDNEFVPKGVNDTKKIVNDSTALNLPKVISPPGDRPISVPQPETNVRNSFATKLLDKRTLKSPSVLRKNIPNIITQKTSLKSKENLSRKNLRVSTGRITSKDPVLILNQNNPLNLKPKLISKIGKGTRISQTTKTVQDQNDNSHLTTDNTNVVNDKKMLNYSVITDNVIDDKELIVFKNPDSDLLESDKSAIVKETLLTNTVPTMPNIKESQTTDLSREDTTVTVTNNKVENVYNPDTTNNNKLSSKSQDNCKVNDLKQDGILVYSNKISPNKMSPENNFVTVIDKGDIIKLKLNLEVRKADGVISANCNIHMDKLNLTEKSSQVEIDELFLQSTPENSHTVNRKLEPNEEISKSPAMHCVCCNGNFKEILHKINNSVGFDGRRYVFLISDPDIIEKLPRCNCEEELTAKVCGDTRLTTSSPIKKVYGNTSLLNVKKNITLTRSFGVTESQTQSTSKSFQEVKKEQQICNELFTSSNNSYTGWAKPFEKRKSDLKQNSSHLAKQFVDNSTQTEWTSILLEARLHEDGRYSFHFPPLHVLQCYQLQNMK